MGVWRQAKAPQNGVEENAPPIIDVERRRPRIIERGTKRQIPVDGRAVAQCCATAAAKAALEVNQTGEAPGGPDEDVVEADVSPDKLRFALVQEASSACDS